MKSAFRFVCVAWAVTLPGCGPDTSHLPATVPASGVVTLDGAPVADAAVTFIADTGNHHATGNTNSAGKFALRAFPEKDGAVVGSYKVEINKTVVSSQDAGTDGEASVTVQHGLPAKYATAATSGLTSTVPEGGSSSLNFDLKSK